MKIVSVSLELRRKHF